MPKAYGEGGLHYPVVFLENEAGIPVTPASLRRGPAVAHDHRDIHAAQRVAVTVDPAPMGLLYHDPELPTYEEIRWGRTDRPDRATFRERLDGLLDRYTVT
jgi:hypothetical protein